MPQKNKAVVLLSAGLDSTVNLYLARKDYTLLKTVTFNYGQKAADQEIRQSKKISAKLSIPHEVIDVSWLGMISTSSLNRQDQHIPVGKEVSIDDHAVSLKTAQSVWVPNRNGVFLNIAAAIAETLQAQVIIPGFNKEEAATFPDNSEAYMKAATEAFKFSTQNQVEVKCLTVQMNKTEIVKKALEEKVPLDLLWPCYFNGDQWCGQCESCLRTKRAMIQNQVDVKDYFL